MSELLPVSIVSIVLAMLSHYRSHYDKLRCRYVEKEHFFFFIMAVVMVLFCGLRTGYNDTDTYKSMYNLIPEDVAVLEGLNWFALGENPGFALTNRVLVRLNFSTQSFLMFYAAVTVGIMVWFFHKYSCNLPLTIFLFIAYAGYIFTLAAIKQCIAMALCLVATDRVVRKKYISFVCWVLIASLYHPYALMYLITPFLTFRPWSFGTVVMLLAFAIAGFSVESLIGTIIDVTDMLGEGFDAESFSGEGVNPFRLAVTAVPVLVSFITRPVIQKEKDRVQNLMLNLTMLNAEIMFVALFGTANYFARLANYFLPFQAISIPWLLTHFETKSRRVITSLAVIGYTGFLIYSQVIHESFDYHYYSTTLWKYLASLF